jgi:shikimate dehydrogenase
LQGTIFRMHKLALVGKKIQHSKSPDIYRKLVGSLIEYDLLDYPNEDDIPSAEQLFKEYLGISITSPYKKHFLSQVRLSKMAQKLGAINCLVKRDGEIWGENTDYFAIVEILSRFKSKHGELSVIILGDGVMSQVTTIALEELNIAHKVYARKTHPQLSMLNLVDCFNQDFTTQSKPIIINTCAREFVFAGICPSDAVFWDYNYEFAPHQTEIPKRVELYVDGMEMLTIQAQFALVFWSTTTSFLNY